MSVLVVSAAPRYASYSAAITTLTGKLQTPEAKGQRLNEENQTANSKDTCEGCVLEERLSALEEVISESQKLLSALRKEARQIRTLLDKEK